MNSNEYKYFSAKRTRKVSEFILMLRSLLLRGRQLIVTAFYGFI